MSTNLLKRSVAVGSALAMAGAALIASPASAAEGDVTLAPAGGLKYGSFSTESFSLAANFATSLNEENLAVEIVNPDQQAMRVTLLAETGSEDIANEPADTRTVKMIGFDSLGDQVDLDSVMGSTGSDSVADLDDAEFNLDFAGLGITRAVIYDFTTDAAQRAAVTFQPLLDNATDTDNSALGALPTDNGTGLDPYTYGDGKPASFSVRAWVENERVQDFETVDAAYASPTRTVTFVDPAAVSMIPRIERFEHSAEELNQSGQTNLATSVQFSDSTLNLDQMTGTLLKFKIAEGGTSSSSVGQVETAVGTSSDIRNRSGFTTKDAAGRLYVELVAQDNLDPGTEYVASFKYNASAAPFFSSTGFTPPTSTDPGLTDVDVVALDTVNSNQTDNAVTLNTATKAFTFEGQVEETAGGTEGTDASVPILFSVKAGGFVSEGNTYTVSGANEIITLKNQTVYGTGFTDSDGEFRVTVTASSPTADDSYEVAMYVLGDDDTFKRSEADYVVSYDASIGGTLTPDATVLSGETVTASFTVTDQFEQPTSTRLGSQLRVSLEASNTDNLDVDADVAADGTVSFTFDNYVVAGSSDVVTAKLYTGSSVASGTVRDTKTMSLYNSDTVASINVPATLTGEVSYVDFIEGKTSTAAPGPQAADGKVDLTGTAVDSNGTGVPGAVVTIAAEGAQFLSGTTYSKDSVTVSASASGVFDVDVWFTELNKTGIDVTVTSGSATATSTVKTYLPTNLDGDNLVFSLSMPENVVMNTTYAVTASLTDKHGNPVQTTGTAGAVEIIGTGSVQINSVNTAADKNFGKDGKATVFLRSIKDIAGPGAVTATLQSDATYKKLSTQTDQTLRITEQTVDVTTTSHDETSFANEISTNVEVYETAGAVPQSSTQKVNAGSFKGYVAVYALGYEGQRLSAKIGNDWVIVDPIVNNESANLARVTDFTGAGVDIAVRIYIDRVLIDTINLTTK